MTDTIVRAKPGRNEHLTINAMAKFDEAPLKFQVQPYHYGSMSVERIVERDVTAQMDVPGKGRATVTYAVYDVHGTVVDGATRSRLFQHVSYRDISGEAFYVTMTADELRRCAFEGATYVSAVCG